MEDAARGPPGHAVHDHLAVRSVRGVAKPADAVLLGDQSPDGAAGDPRPPPDTDPAPSQQHEASRARATDPVGLGQITVMANRLGGIRRWGLRGGPDDGEVSGAVSWWLSGREA